MSSFIPCFIKMAVATPESPASGSQKTSSSSSPILPCSRSAARACCAQFGTWAGPWSQPPPGSTPPLRLLPGNSGRAGTLRARTRRHSPLPPACSFTRPSGRWRSCCWCPACGVRAGPAQCATSLDSRWPRASARSASPLWRRLWKFCSSRRLLLSFRWSSLSFLF